MGWSETIGWTNTTFVIKRTQDYYSGTTKQILSTPFQFYFGLLNGKTGLDKFVDYFGPKNAFILTNYLLKKEMKVLIIKFTEN